MDSSNKVVFITGCSSGIGRALAEDCLSRGCKLVATARKLESLQTLGIESSEIERIPLDVDDPIQIRVAVRQAQDRFGRIDVLINNAGYGQMAPMMEVSGEMLRAQLMTNTIAPLLLSQAVAPLMRAQGGGIIANIASVSGNVATPFAGAYCASKSAIVAISDVMRMELAPFGIQVVTVQAGAIRSGFGDAALKRVPAESAESWYAPQNDAIRSRAGASQGKSMEATTFANRLNTELLSGSPSAVIRLGPLSRLLPVLKAILPTAAMDRVLRRRFGLK